MNNLLFGILDAIDNKTMLLILMIVLIAFIVLLAVLGIVFIIALRKRAPVVKVVMAPDLANEEDPEEEQQQEQTEVFVSDEVAAEAASEDSSGALVIAQSAVQTQGQGHVVSGALVVPEPEEGEEDDEEDGPKIVIEGQERVRYSRSFMAKVCQLNNDAKEWYSQLKNDLLSYERVKTRMSWRRETFRIGRMTVARLTVRGKTLCLMLAVEPAGYSGTKYSVEDVSNVAATSDTPTLYRIKSARKLKYAKEMIAGLMKEIKIYKDPRYEAKDYFLPYEGDLALMHRGLVKRIVTGTTRAFKIEEIDPSQIVDVELTKDAEPVQADEQPADGEQVKAEEVAAAEEKKPSKAKKQVKDEAAATTADSGDTDNNA